MVQILNNLLQKLESKVEASTYYSKDQMKGLVKFIMDIRLCKSREAEIKRVNKELANIRNRFRTDKNIDGYHKKKYIAKLIFMFLLGYDVNIGQSEAIFLLASTKQSEKQIGYLFLSLLSNPDDTDANQILNNCVISDLRSINFYNIMIAANCIPFIINDDLVRELGPPLHDLILNTSPENSEYQSLLTCYLSFIKHDKQYFEQNQDIITYFIRLFPKASDMVLLPLANVMYEGSLIDGDAFSSSYSDIIDQLFKLCRVTKNSPMSYYNILSPWTIVKLLQLLQLLNCTSQHTASLSKLLLHIFSLENPQPSVSPHKKIHYINILNAIKFEAVNVATTTYISDECVDHIYIFLSKMLDSAETNNRFLSLESLVRMKHTPSFTNMIKEFSVKLSDLIATEKNSSLRLQAVTVIYSIGDLSNSKEIVENMVKFLTQSEFCIRQELTLKICTIASKNISDAKWYIDNMISVLCHGRDYTGEEVWFKVVQTVSKHKDIQLYAAKTLLTYLNSPNCPENVVKLGVYLIGEYGHIIPNEAALNSQSQYNLIIGLFPFHSNITKLIILTALVKMAHNHPTLKQPIIGFFSSNLVSQNVDSEIQQRACEYKEILTKDTIALSSILAQMPPYEFNEIDGKDYEGETETTSNLDRASSFNRNSASANDILYNNELMERDSLYDGNNNFSMQNNNMNNVNLSSNSDNQVKNYQFLSSFLLTTQGTLYEDNLTSIRLSSLYSRNMGSHEISMESVDPYTHLKIIMITPNHHDGVVVAPFSQDTIRTYSGGCSATIKTMCCNLFTNNPIINLTYVTSNNPQNYMNLSLALPIDIINYMEPYTIEPSNFMTTWNSMSSVGLESTEIFEASTIFDSNIIYKKLKMLNMEIITGIDPNPSNFVTASAFYSQSFVGGCITRLETKPDSATMRLTVRASTPELTMAISKKMKSFI